MANSYTMASFEIPVKDVVLTERRMKILEAWITDGAIPLPASEFGDKVAAVEEKLATLDSPGWIGCQWKVASHDGGHFLWMAHDESIDLEVVVVIAQIMLELDDNDATFTLEWASICDKPRVGEFCGGAVAMNRHDTAWMNTGAAAAKLCQQLTTPEA